MSVDNRDKSQEKRQEKWTGGEVSGERVTSSVAGVAVTHSSGWESSQGVESGGSDYDIADDEDGEDNGDEDNGDEEGNGDGRTTAVSSRKKRRRGEDGLMAHSKRVSL